MLKSFDDQVHHRECVDLNLDFVDRRVRHVRLGHDVAYADP